MSDESGDESAPPPAAALVVHVAEKPSVALALATALAGTNQPLRTSHHPIAVHRFLRQGVPHAVSSVRGHVFSLDFAPGRCDSWDSEPAECFDAPTLKTPCSTAVVAHLSALARGASQLVLWLDADAEGESIAFEVIHICEPHLLPSYDGCPRVRRARFSAVSPESILTAFARLGQPDVNLAAAVDARAELDLKVGVAWTRYLTKRLCDRFRALHGCLISYGPCQTPALSFVVERHHQRRTFAPEPFWCIEVALVLQPSARTENAALAPAAGGAAPTLRPSWWRKRLFDQRIAVMLLQQVRRCPVAHVAHIAAKTSTRPRPPALNTVSLLRAASAGLNMSAMRTMRVAEDLYLQGFISYPRTESSAFPPGFDVHSPLAALAGHEYWEAVAAPLLSKCDTNTKGGNTTERRVGIDAGDHPPITPTYAAGPSDVGGGERWRVYNLVASYFLASLSEDAEMRTTCAEFDVGGERFELSSVKIETYGWYAALPYRAPTEIELPFLEVGDTLAVTRADLSSAMTEAPPVLSESDLLGQMEMAGIGTDASMPTHIKNLEARRYIRLAPSVEGRRAFEPTPLGISLIEGCGAIDPDLVSPAVRSHVETQLKLVEKGDATRAAVLAHVLNEFRSKFHYFSEHAHLLDAAFIQHFGEPREDPGTRARRAGGRGQGVPIAAEGGGARLHTDLVPTLRPFTRSGINGRPLLLVPEPEPHLYDASLGQTWALPYPGTVKPLSGRSCLVCDFELCLYIIKTRPERAFPLCPNCWQSELGDEGLEQGSGYAVDKTWCDGRKAAAMEDASSVAAMSSSVRAAVLYCPHPETHPAVAELVVSPCPISAKEGGRLLLDPRGGPTWRLVSSRAPFAYRLPAFVHRVTVGPRCPCPSVDCRVLQVEFHRNYSPLPDGSLVHEGCLRTDTLLRDLCEAEEGGKGRGGRGRGSHKGKGKGGGGKRRSP